MIIRAGDLIYIPQNVDMWDFAEGTTGVKYYKTHKPTTGVFLKMDAFNTCRVFADGQERSVTLKCVYPMEEVC